ncbi:MAG: YadA-like family protein [Oxalobacter sp.]|nr:YadA-like family protein [Oxalobacter sp.]
MNRTFKVIFNQVLGRHVVVSEIASSIQRGARKAVMAVAAGGALAAAALLPMGEAGAISSSYVPSYSSQYGSSGPADYQTDGGHVDVNQIGGYNQQAGSYYNYVYVNDDGTINFYKNENYQQNDISSLVGNVAIGNFSQAGTGADANQVNFYNYSYQLAYETKPEGATGTWYQTSAPDGKQYWYASSWNDRTYAYSPTNSYGGSVIEKDGKYYHGSWSPDLDDQGNYQYDEQGNTIGSYKYAEIKSNIWKQNPDNPSGNLVIDYKTVDEYGQPVFDLKPEDIGLDENNPYGYSGGTNNVAVGNKSKTLSHSSVAVGDTSTARGYRSVAIGAQAEAGQENAGGDWNNGTSAVAIGDSAKAYGGTSVAVGHNAQTYSFSGVAVGNNANASTEYAIAIGDNARVAYVGDADSDDTKKLAVHGIAIGRDTLVEGKDGTAVGRQSQALMRNATAYGNNAHADAFNSVAIGNKAIAGSQKDTSIAQSAVAVGNRATATEEYTTAIGASTYASGTHSVAVGDSNRATGAYSTAIGAGWSTYTVDEDDNYNTEAAREYESIGANQATGDYSTSVGYGNATLGQNSTAVGMQNAVSGKDSLAYGSQNKVGSDRDPGKTDLQADAKTVGNVTGYAVGSYNKVTGNKGLAVGTENEVSGEQSIAIGTGHKVSGKNSGAIGDPSKVSGNNSYAVGNNNTIEVDKGFVLGNDASVTTEGGVALGQDSVASTGPSKGGYDMLTEEKEYTDGTSTWQSTHGAVSVGDAGSDITRQITGVAAGTEDTDAVNVAQLKRVAENSGTAITFQGDVGDDIKKPREVKVYGGITDESKLATEDNIGVVSDGKKNLKVRLAKNVNLGPDGSVTTGDTTINNNGMTIKGGPQVTKKNVDMAGNQVHNVAAGTADTDAVNVSQLKDMSANYDQKINHLNGRIGEVAQDANAGIAMALAAASLPQVYLPGKSMMAVAGGTYRGEQGYAIGFSTISDDGKWIIKAHASGNSQGHYGAAVGAGYMW